MTYFEDWNDAALQSLNSLWDKIINFIPELLGALLVLIIGLVLATGLSKLVHKLVMYTRIDKLLMQIDAVKNVSKAGIKFSFAGLLAWVVKWFFIIVTLIAVVDILNLPRVTGFLNEVALYFPNVLVAVIILAIGLVVGQFIYDVVEKSAKTAKVTKHTSHTLAVIGKWSFIIFALMAALVQLGIAPNLIEILFTGLIAMLTLAMGLAFGLGGKDQAAKWLDRAIKKH